MQNNDKQYFIYNEATHERITVSKEVHNAYYRESWRVRSREKTHLRCCCPVELKWECDADCTCCKYHKDPYAVSIDGEVPDTDELEVERIENPDAADPEREAITEILYDTLMDLFRQLDSNADRIADMRLKGYSERQIAVELGIPQRTYADRMKRTKTALRNKCPLK